MLDKSMLITISEAARLLPCSVPTLRQMIQLKQFPVVRVGKQLRVDPAKLKKWIDKGGLEGGQSS